MKTSPAVALAFLVPPLLALAPLDEEASQQAFMAKYRQANEISDASEMARLIKKNQQYAVESIIYTAEAIGNGPTDELEKDMAGFRKGWKQAYRTSFVDDVYEYHSLLKPSIKKDRAAVKVRFGKQATKFVEAEAAGDKNAFGAIAMEFETLGEGFEKMGDRYYESQCFLFAALSVDERLRGTDANLQKAYVYYDRCAKARETVGLKDQNFIDVKQRLEGLAAEGWSDVPEAGEGGAAGGGRQPGQPAEGAVVSAAMTFELLSGVTGIRRPTYVCDDMYMVWPSVYLQRKGSQGKFAAVESKAPAVIRESSSKVFVDQDGDGKGDIPIPLKGKVVPVECEIGEGAAKRKWAIFTMTGGQRDSYQGIQLNLEPTEDQMTIYVNAAGSMVGTIGETQVQVIDDNLDGVYGSPAKLWGNVGTTENVFQIDLDSILVGKEKGARPWSEFQQIDETWYRMEALDGGTKLQATEVELKTGRLKLKTKGPKPTFVVLKGIGDVLGNSYYDLVLGGSKGVEVPVGRYEVAVGLLQTGKRMDVKKALMLKGENTRIWTVKVGETTEVELGAPFGFDFDVVVGNESVKVVGKTVAVVGASKERYERLWGCVPKPEASVRKEGSKKGSKPEDMKLVGSQDEIGQYGWDAAWYPLDVELEKPKNAEAVEVQLTEKKNKLFGKIESEWQG